MNPSTFSSTSLLTVGTLALATLLPTESAFAQNQTLHERLRQEHRERRTGIIDGIGEVFSSIFDGGDDEYRSRRSIYDERDPDRIYEPRSGRSAPPGWDAPFPPPRDMVTARDRYDIYQNEQRRRAGSSELREWRPEEQAVEERATTNRVPAPAQSTSTEGTQLTIEGDYYDKPTFFEKLPDSTVQESQETSDTVQAPTTVLQPAPTGDAVLPEPQPLATDRSVSIPDGMRENRRIGSRMEAAVGEVEAVGGSTAPADESPQNDVMISDFPDLATPPPAPSSSEPEVIGNQASTPITSTDSLPMDLSFATSSGGTVSLGDLLEGNRAVMIDFWATWSGESMTNLSSINTLSAEMQAMGIAVVGMNFDGNADTVERVRTGQDITVPWLLEPRSRPFSRDMKVEKVPHRMLVDSQGRVRFSGDPDDDSLRQVIDSVVNEGLSASVPQ